MTEKPINDKVVVFLRKKINKISNEELDEYLKKLDLILPEDGITDEFLKKIYSRISSNANISKPDIKRHKELGYGLRDLSIKDHHWRDDLKNSNFKIKRPIIICLPGNGSITSKKANGFCKTIERMLGLNHEAEPKVSSYDLIDILGVHYGTDNEKQTAGTINEKESEDFVNRFILPLCVDDKGNALNLEKVCANISLITFCSHCYGATALDIIMTTFTNKLTSLGFTKEDIKTIKSYMCQITYSPYTNSSPVPTIRIDSMTDSFHKEYAEQYAEIYGSHLDGVSIQYDKSGMFRNSPSKFPNSYEILHILSSRLLNLEDNRDMSKLIDEHTIEYLSREENWQITEKSRNAKNADLVSMLMAYSLSWAVTKALNTQRTNTSQPKTNLNDELRQALESITEMFSASELKM